MSTVRQPDVLIIGAGPAGLSAAAVLGERALVLDREAVAGGIPRHSDHPGYGLRDLHRVLSGPAYARRLVELARASGADIRTEATVTGWAGLGPLDREHAVDVTTPQGRLRVEPRAIVLATGARERPRAARLVPGDRPPGVLTTGALQNLVHLQHARPGTRAVVVGAEAVSWSAVLTLRSAGCATVLMTTELDAPPAYLAFSLAGRIGLRVPVATSTRITRIIGHRRLEAIEVEDLRTGQRRRISCDTVVFTGDWIPDHELARTAGLAIDPGTQGPLVDTALRTSRAGVFAAGNLLHPVDTADVAALDGRHVAAQVIEWLGGGTPAADGVRVRAGDPFRWVAPGLLRAGDPPPPRGRLLLWPERLIRTPRVLIRQDGHTIAERRLPWPAAPGRVFSVPAHLLAAVDYAGGDVTITAT
jgi:thioredoxin reductase